MFMLSTIKINQSIHVFKDNKHFLTSVIQRDLIYGLCIHAQEQLKAEYINLYIFLPAYQSK